eukprot:653982-Alexandrium_andersonii.AAC.1
MLAQAELEEHALRTDAAEPELQRGSPRSGYGHGIDPAYDIDFDDNWTPRPRSPIDWPDEGQEALDQFLMQA